MTVLEEIVHGIFSLLSSWGSILLVLWILSRFMSNMKFASWGKVQGSLPMFNLKRLRCEHKVRFYGPGAYGKVGYWCSDCGKDCDTGERKRKTKR